MSPMALIDVADPPGDKTRLLVVIYWLVIKHLLQLSMVQIFQKRMPPEAIDLASRLLQYSPNLRCNAVSKTNLTTSLHFYL